MLKKVKAGYYLTLDGKIAVEKDGGFWYAYDIKTGQSVVDCERTLSEIKIALSGYLERTKEVQKQYITEKYDMISMLYRIEFEDGYFKEIVEKDYEHERDFDYLIAKHGNITHIYISAQLCNGGD